MHYETYPTSFEANGQTHQGVGYRVYDQAGQVSIDQWCRPSGGFQPMTQAEADVFGAEALALLTPAA